MRIDVMRLFSLLGATWLLLVGQSQVAMASEPCPLGPNSFLLSGAFEAAFAAPGRDDDRDLRALLTSTANASTAVRACWTLAELQARQNYKRLESSPTSSASSTVKYCGTDDEPWSGPTYWLTPEKPKDKPEDKPRDCADLRRKLLGDCLSLAIGDGSQCVLKGEGADRLDQNLTALLKELCRIKDNGVKACSELLKPDDNNEETAAAKRTRLALAGVSFGLGAAALAVGITHLVIPLGVGLAGNCPEHGLNYPCAPDRFGLGIPLTVTGGLFAAAGIVLLRVRF